METTFETTYKDDNDVEWQIRVDYSADPAEPSVGLLGMVYIHNIKRRPVVRDWASVDINDYRDIAIEMIEDEKQNA